MDYVVPEKNEAAFLRWQKERKWLIRLFWAMAAMFVLTVYLFILLLQQEGKITLPEVMAGDGYTATRWEIVGFVLLSLVYVIVLIVIRLCYIKWRLGLLSKEACIFAAILAAEDLDKGNSVRACLYTDRLLLALSDFLGQKLVTLGVSYITPTDIMHITPEAIPKRAVLRAMEASAETKEIKIGLMTGLSGPSINVSGRGAIHCARLGLKVTPPLSPPLLRRGGR